MVVASCSTKTLLRASLIEPRHVPLAKECKYGQWALSWAGARVCSIRCHTDGNARFTMMSVHVNNNCTKHKNLVAHFLLTVREELAAEGVDMGLRRLEWNGQHQVVCFTNIRCEGPSHSRPGQVRAGFELQGQQCSLPCAHPHVPRCGPVPYEEQTKEANGDLEAEQLLRLSSVTKCRSRIRGLFWRCCQGAHLVKRADGLVGESRDAWFLCFCFADSVILQLAPHR